MLVGKFKILLNMLRPERMTSASIICVKKDVESVLETLSFFGEFHIEQSPQDEVNLRVYNQSIQIVEESLLDLTYLSSQLVKEKTGLFDIFKLKQPITVNVTADNWRSLLGNTNQNIRTLKKEIEGLNTSLKSLKEKASDLMLLKDMLSTIQDMGIDLATMGKFKLVHVEIARLPKKNFEPFEMSLAQLPLNVHTCPLVGDFVFVCLAMPTKHQEEVEKILHTYHAEIFQLPPELPANAVKALKQVKNLLNENEEKQKELKGKFDKLEEENRSNFFAWKETSENILALLNAEKKILQSGRLATIKGFVPQDKFGDLSQAVHGKVEDKALILPNDTLENADTPTKITHNRFVKPFEELTKLYGLPKYEEVDPTPFLAITFPIIFGLMFGDLGHGLVLLLGGVIVGSLIKGNQGMKNVCWIIAACGIGAIGAGLLFGEFFGTELPWGPLWFSPFSPTGNVFNFLIFSLFVGIVQIVSGLIIEMVNYALKHEYADAFLTSVPKIAFYMGGIYLIATYQLDFAAWLSGPILAPIIPFIVMVAGKPLYLMAAKPAGQHKNEHAEQDTIIGRLFEGGDFFTRLLSNTISYSRILALLMAHWALLLVVYQVSGLVEGLGILGLVLSGVVVVFGNIFVLALEGLIVFIHTLRLHFYEWFSKFYAGTGTEFQAFKQKFVYTKLSMKENKD